MVNPPDPKGGVRNDHMGPTKAEGRKIIDSKVPGWEGNMLVPRRLSKNNLMPSNKVVTIQ